MAIRKGQKKAQRKVTTALRRKGSKATKRNIIPWETREKEEIVAFCEKHHAKGWDEMCRLWQAEYGKRRTRESLRGKWNYLTEGGKEPGGHRDDDAGLGACVGADPAAAPKVMLSNEPPQPLCDSIYRLLQSGLANHDRRQEMAPRAKSYEKPYEGRLIKMLSKGEAPNPFDQCI
ncbi:hypothetical protein BGW36DRAFT_362873 [Talaromyces proteolyticus]|uniref:Myb-like domain-containing protein n=1 Tax=Talaromyces proteolyticus TaxID=1131652 RepID=A0AAD4PSP8_9EURO|nr:uncharacterized protein BGW36DRAFT_362873 [Talaromyces proteolyticus]KAH8691841.1 hypothetical protein BGW36DRAFT_362873 [Talaromyces proteolyticus]